MTIENVPYDTLKKDGSSQRSRGLKALDPLYFQPDERSIKDWLLFISKLTGLIRFEDGYGTKDLTWSSFLEWKEERVVGSVTEKRRAEELEKICEEISRYLEDPASSPWQNDVRRKSWVTRPHFVLLMTFLKLLQHSKDALNTFTQRHLDFYYRDVLKFRHHPFIPDRAHAIVTLEPDVDRFVLEKGTLLDAGTGPSGDAIRFVTTNEFFLNRARITSQKSVFLDKETLDLAAIHAKYKKTSDEGYGLWPVLKLVYGSPASGNAMPPFRGTPMTREILATLHHTLTIPLAGKISLSEFKALMSAQLRAVRGESELWNVVDYLLTEYGRRVNNDPSFSVSGTTSESFLTNLQRAIGDINITGTALDYYESIVQAERYFFLEAEDIEYLIRIWLAPNADEVPEREWEEVYRLLIAAYHTRGTQQRVETLQGIHTTGFDELIRFALGHPTPGDPLPVYAKSLEDIVNDIDQGQASIHEAYLRDELFLSIKDFRAVMALGKGETTAEAREQGYQALERAYRQKRMIVDKDPLVEEWYNLYKSDDATASRPFPTSDAWKPFGVDRQGETVPIGIAIESPLLALEEGERSIIVKLVFAKDSLSEQARQGLNKDPFLVQLSRADSFFSPRRENISIGPIARGELNLTGRSDGMKVYDVLTVTIVLKEDDPKVEALKEISWPTEHPVIKLVLREQKDGEDEKVPYTLYKDLRLESVTLNVEAKGLKSVTLENDDGELNSKKPFEPFGSFPLVGSRFCFFHPEIANKRLDSLTLAFEWMGKPEDIAAYYKGYDEATDGKFTAALKMVDNKMGYNLESIDLFPGNTTVAMNVLQLQHPAYSSNVITLEEGSYLADSERYFFLELNTPDFQHTNYPSVNMAKSMAYAKALAEKPAGGTIRPEDYQVNAPYTPKLKSFAVGYKAQAVIRFSDPQQGRVYHLHPFGVEPLDQEPERFLPSFEEEGSLFIGLEEFQPPDTVCLYFKFLEGSADPRTLKPDVLFSYLTEKGWQALDVDNILSDTTDGLSNSGILQLAIPGDATTVSSILPAGKHWLKLSVLDNSAGIHNIQGIWTQGIEAVMEPSNDYLNIPAETIASPAASIPSVKSIYQPYPSLGGKPAEKDTFFYIRISERLRHKQRAANVWDYEKIVLQHFPEVYKVKALPSDKEHRAVRLVVIPDLTGKAGMNLFEPRLGQAGLQRIRYYLKQHTSTFADVLVQNPEYLQVKVRISVRLKKGFNEVSSRRSINEALQRSLSPWAFETQREISFGGRINANTIVNFLETQPGIEYIIGLKFFTSRDGEEFTFVQPTQGKENTLQIEVEASSPETILVSAPQHDIDIVQDDLVDHDDMAGIGYMKIGLDFKVS